MPEVVSNFNRCDDDLNDRFLQLQLGIFPEIHSC